MDASLTGMITFILSQHWLGRSGCWYPEDSAVDSDSSEPGFSRREGRDQLVLAAMCMGESSGFAVS